MIPKDIYSKSFCKQTITTQLKVDRYQRKQNKNKKTCSLLE